MRDRAVARLTLEKDLRHARMVNGLLADGGLERRELTLDELHEREPTLQGKIIGGFWTESDSTGDIHKFTMGLADWLKTKGVEFKLGHPVTDLHVRDDGVYVECGHEQRYDGIVVSAGVASRKFAQMLGDRVNIYPVKGYSITVNLTDAASQAAAPTTSLLDDKAKIVSSRLGKSRLRIAGTAEFNGENRDILERRVRPLIQWCEEHFPDVSTENCVPWAGLRPMMPNMMPRVGPGKKDRVFYNTGHGHLGWTLSPATADTIGAAVTARFKSNSMQ